jgi:hypothetical protein
MRLKGCGKESYDWSGPLTLGGQLTNLLSVSPLAARQYGWIRGLGEADSNARSAMKAHFRERDLWLGMIEKPLAPGLVVIAPVSNGCL